MHARCKKLWSLADFYALLIANENAARRERAVIAFYSFAAPPNVHVVDVQYTQAAAHTLHSAQSQLYTRIYSSAAHRPRKTMHCCCAFVLSSRRQCYLE